MIQLRSNHSGFSLLELIVAVGLVGILALSIGYPVILHTQMSVGVDALTAMNSVRTNFWRVLQDDKAWNQMLQNYVADGNASLACLENHSDCSAFIGLPQTLLVFDRNNLAVTPVAGFGTDSKGCTGFSTASPTDACPFRIKVTWQPRCKAGTCIDPEFLIKASFLYVPRKVNAQIGNIAKFNFSLYRQPLPVSSGAQACSASGGTWNVATQTCTPSGTPPVANCPPGQGIVGFSSATTPICQSLPFTGNLQCAVTNPASYLLGFTTDVLGNLVPNCGQCN